jgi:uncharacterized protein
LLLMRAGCWKRLKSAMISAKAGQLVIVSEILARLAPGVEARAFGSRVAGGHKEYSDLDLALVGREKLSAGAMEALREAFSESDLPFRVDILDWHAISDEFRAVIAAKYEVLK